MRSLDAETRARAPGRSWRKKKHRLGQERGALRPVAVSPSVRAEWMREALALQAEAAVKRSFEAMALDRENERCALLKQLLDRPVVALDAENRSQSLETHAVLSPTLSAQPAIRSSDARQNPRVVCHERVQGTVRSHPRRLGAFCRHRPLAIDPLLSNEVRARRFVCACESQTTSHCCQFRCC